MLRPPRALPPSPHLAVLALSSPSELPRITEAVAKLEARGVRVTLAPNIGSHGSSAGYLAGDDEERLSVANAFFRSDDYDGFLFARGGYGAMRILDRIDYGAIAAQGTLAGTQKFQITVSAAALCGQTLDFSLAITSQPGSLVTSATFKIRVGGVSGTAAPVWAAGLVPVRRP